MPPVSSSVIRKQFKLPNVGFKFVMIIFSASLWNNDSSPSDFVPIGLVMQELEGFSDASVLMLLLARCHSLCLADIVLSLGHYTYLYYLAIFKFLLNCFFFHPLQKIQYFKVDVTRHSYN